MQIYENKLKKTNILSRNLVFFCLAYFWQVFRRYGKNISLFSVVPDEGDDCWDFDLARGRG